MNAENDPAPDAPDQGKRPEPGRLSLLFIIGVPLLITAGIAALVILLGGIPEP